MKRIFRLLVMVTVLCFLPGCVSSRNYTQPDTVNYNYNNCTALNSRFCFTEDAMYYSDRPGVLRHFFRISEDRTNYITSSCNHDYSCHQVCEGIVYMVDMYDSPEVNRIIYRIRSYNPDSNSIKTIGYFENLNTSFVFQNKLYYTQRHHGEDLYRVSLQMYDLETEKETCLFENIFCAGVMKDRIAFVTQENSTYHVYSYDGEVTEIADFEYECDPEEDMWDRKSNFTSDKIVLTADKELVCCDVTTGQTQIFTFEGFMDSVIAYEEYAFVTECIYLGNDGPIQQTLYRIRLSDGFKETIAQFDDSIFTYVDSDGYVYVEIGRSETIYRYTPDGERTPVYKNGIF